MRPTLFFLLLPCLSPVFAQRDSLSIFRAQGDRHMPVVVGADSLRAGDVRVVESDRVRLMMADYAARKQTLRGYRVQIFLGDRGTAENTRRAFLVQHPEVPAYLSYLAPNFRVRVGDLRDRVSAEALRELLKPEFPGLYIVPDDIEPPALIGRDVAK